MYSKQTAIGYAGVECVMTRGAPYRTLLSSRAATMAIQTSDAGGFAVSNTLVPSIHFPLRRAAPEPFPSQDEDFEMLMRKNRRTLELLAK